VILDPAGVERLIRDILDPLTAQCSASQTVQEMLTSQPLVDLVMRTCPYPCRTQRADAAC
jgi:hypothetical protein